MSDQVTYGVYLHSTGRQGGFVPRTQYDGIAPNPYSQAQPVKVCKTMLGAETFAEKLNSGEITLPVCRLCGNEADLDGHTLSCPTRYYV